MTIKLGRVMSKGEGAPPTLSSKFQSSDCMLFEKRHVSTNPGLQNSAGVIKHRKTYKSKAFFVIQKMLTFDSYLYTSRYRYTSY